MLVVASVKEVVTLAVVEVNIMTVSVLMFVMPSEVLGTRVLVLAIAAVEVVTALVPHPLQVLSQWPIISLHNEFLSITWHLLDSNISVLFAHRSKEAVVLFANEVVVTVAVEDEVTVVLSQPLHVLAH